MPRKNLCVCVCVQLCEPQDFFGELGLLGVISA